MSNNKILAVPGGMGLSGKNGDFGMKKRPNMDYNF